MEELGRFALRRQIGAGSNSIVYEADEGGQRCALRVFNQDAVPTDPAERAAVLAAMKGLTRLEHPCIVRVLEVGDTQGKIYASMELMSCPTLAEKLKSGGPMEEKRVVLFVRQAAQALDKARDMGYSHGNLHAGNAFVVSDEKIKLSDFAMKDIVSDRSVLKDYDELARMGEDLVTAEDLLRAKGKAGGGQQKLAEDFVALSLLLMHMLGVEPETRGPAESLSEYRDRVLHGSFAVLASPEKALSPNTVEIARRLLTPGGFDSPGEVVVELASAMLLRRAFGRASAAEDRQTSPGSVTLEVSKDSDLVSEWLDQPDEADKAEGGGQNSLEVGPEAPTGMFTAFYVWHSRHGGIFFIVHDGEELSIGRDPDYADIALMDPAISRKHCVISKRAGVIRVEDPGSTNGTLVNGQRVQSAEIKPGDNVRIGGTRVYMTLSTQEE